MKTFDEFDFVLKSLEKDITNAIAPLLEDLKIPLKANVHINVDIFSVSTVGCATKSVMLDGVEVSGTWRSDG